MRLFLMLMAIVTIMLICLFLTGCGVTAKSYMIEEEGVMKHILEIDRGAKAEFPDGGKIEADAWLEFPPLPPIEIDQ